MLAPIPNEKIPPATTSGTLGFVFQTTPHLQQKDAIDDLILHDSDFV